MKKLMSLVLVLCMVLGMSVSVFAEGTNYAKIGDTEYATLAEAIAAVGEGDVVIELLNDATLDYGAREAYGTDATTSLKIKGNNHTLTLNQTNSDWSSVGLKNQSAKLILENMTIEKTGYGDTSGAWNTHAINFHCEVKMTNVTVNNAISVQDGAELVDVTINEANEYYGLWVSGNGQSVTVTGGAINATNGGRGIKIADQYVGSPVSVNVSVNGTTFNTAKKAAILVSSVAGAEITATNVDISKVQADNETIVWVDDDSKYTDSFDDITVNGGNVVVEGAKYSFSADVTEFKVGEATDVNITLKGAADASSFSNVLIKCVITDKNGATVQEGTYGPSTGFPVQAGYDVTTKLEDVVFNKAGTLTATFSLINVSTSAEIASSKITLIVEDEEVEEPIIVEKEETYKTVIESTENGSVKADSKKVTRGEKVTLTVTPDKGYELAALLVIDEDGNERKVTENEDGTFSFRMPEGGVTVEAEFVKIGAAATAPSTEKENPSTGAADFVGAAAALAVVSVMGMAALSIKR